MPTGACVGEPPGPPRGGRVMNLRGKGIVALVSVGALAASMISGGQAVATPPALYRDASQPVERRVADLLGRMTLDEKIGQMTQAERAAVAADPSLMISL